MRIADIAVALLAQRVTVRNTLARERVFPPAKIISRELARLNYRFALAGTVTRIFITTGIDSTLRRFVIRGFSFVNGEPLDDKWRRDICSHA